MDAWTIEYYETAEGHSPFEGTWKILTMKHRDYVAQREAQDPEFRKTREASRPRFEFRVALVRARLAAGLTQAEVAEAIGTKQSAIARLESGESNPTLDMMARLATALAVSFEIRPNATVEAHETELTV